MDGLQSASIFDLFELKISGVEDFLLFNKLQKSLET